MLVDITKDAQLGTCEFDWDAAAPDLEALARPGHSSGVDPLALINAAERPLILAGHGIMLGGAEAALQAFAEKAQIPVAMTLLGIGGFPASHPLNLGMMGMHGEAWVNTAIQEADLLIALGMRFDDRVTGNLKTYAPNAKKIHVDIDPAEFNKNVHGRCGDLRRRRRRASASWMPRVARRRSLAVARRTSRELKGDSAVRDIQNLPDDGHLYAAHVINDIWRITEGKAVVVTDVGQHQMWEAQYYKHETPRSLITSGGLGTMGFALPAAIGAKMGRPDAEVWVVVGDGGFQMTMPELATLVQEELDVKIAIINNGYLGHGAAVAGVLLPAPLRRHADLRARLREAGRGVRHLVGATVTDARRGGRRRRRRRGAQRGALIDFRVEQEDSVYPMVPAGADLHKMIRRPSPIAETAAD